MSTTRRPERALAGLLLVAFAACAHTPRFDPTVRPTCLVLSAGGPDGVVHLGALQAVQEAHLPVAAVVGSSMGALTGAIYVTAPAQDPVARFRALTRRYEEATLAEMQTNGLGLGLLFGALATLATAGAAWPAFAAGAGFALGAAGTERLDQQRLVRVMDETFAQARLEALPIPFVPLYWEPSGSGVKLVTPRAGNLAAAVGGSVANPLLFPDLDVARAPRLDPGADRAAAVPVEDACRLFPRHNLLAVNVTGRPVFTSAAMTCPVREVRIAPPGISADAVAAAGTAFEAAVARGREATRAALAAPP